MTERPSSVSSASSVTWPLAVCSVFTPPRAAAVFGLTSATLSQVILLSGFGSSCSQPRLAKRPSKTAGSVRNAISSPSDGAFGAPAPAHAPGFTRRALASKAVPATTPSWSARFQRFSKSTSPSTPCQWARTIA